VRILIDTSFVARGPSGTATYIESLVSALRGSGAVEVVQPPKRRRLRSGRPSPRGRRNPFRSAANAALDALWLHVTLPRAARRAHVDAIHHPLPAHSAFAQVPQVVTVHDVAFERLPGHFDPIWRRLARRAHARALQGAAAVICVSEATAEDAVTLLGARRERVVVAHHGPGQPLPEATDGASAREHFLYVGDAEPRKNVAGLLDAYAAYREGAADEPRPLVLAGAAAELADTRAGVSGVPEPSRERLAQLLSGAAALVHASLHEGFGLTLLEAMASGVPVVAVRNPGTEELCGDAALLVEPADLASALERAAEDPKLRKQLAGRGRARAAEFSWAQSAAQHERAYTLAVRYARPRSMTTPPRLRQRR
jgi:glycosyltransferase involved in cell wall biosynthesis